ncbi:hypothetical protein KQX54_019587 [Cotesia glomerata]|uniref:Uncharacterized protein n=1 Tax=Cotesia glomerata TaxID=32391 RepID=A0AAV7I1V0_COTGL|nr:hypothetical protein KQX54_019587 [Cotesia glomerata]
MNEVYSIESILQRSELQNGEIFLKKLLAGAFETPTEIDRTWSRLEEDNGLELGRMLGQRVKIGLRLAGSHYNNLLLLSPSFSFWRLFSRRFTSIYSVSSRLGSTHCVTGLSLDLPTYPCQRVFVSISNTFTVRAPFN